MPGTKEGGLRAAATNMKRHGLDFYKRIGAKGGALGTTGGFAAGLDCYCDTQNAAGDLPVPHHKARCAGVRGGRFSRHKKQPKIVGDINKVYEEGMMG